MKLTQQADNITVSIEMTLEQLHQLRLVLSAVQDFAKTTTDGVVCEAVTELMDILDDDIPWA